MVKGLDISFQLNENPDDERLVLALANLTGNHFKEEFDIRWKIFHVTLENKKFYKVLFTGKKINYLHKGLEKSIREYFDELAQNSRKYILEMYENLSKKGDFQKENIEELKEEYDLWQDKLCNYI
ncbi:DUF2004 domain-containing protein [Caldiplasma sukawensis]